MFGRLTSLTSRFTVFVRHTFTSIRNSSFKNESNFNHNYDNKTNMRENKTKNIATQNLFDILFTCFMYPTDTKQQ